MFYSRFLPVSRESALKTIRRTSGFFIWGPIIILVLSIFPFFEAWSKSHPPPSDILDVINMLPYMAGKFVRNDWFYVLVLVNALFLRRHNSRVAALLFVVPSIYGVGLGLYMLWTMMSAHVSQQLILIAISVIVASAVCCLLAARSLAAAVKLTREFANDPIVG